MRVNQIKILKILFHENYKKDFWGQDIRKETGLSPVVFLKEIRALINLYYISTKGDGFYQITDAGIKALNARLEDLKKSINKNFLEEKNKELFK